MGPSTAGLKWAGLGPPTFRVVFVFLIPLFLPKGRKRRDNFTDFAIADCRSPNSNRRSKQAIPINWEEEDEVVQEGI